jgi:hypothetical protein
MSILVEECEREIQSLTARLERCSAALDAEHERANRAEARILTAPHSSHCWVYLNVPVPLLRTGAGMDRCTCWHSQATA